MAIPPMAAYGQEDTERGYVPGWRCSVCGTLFIAEFQDGVNRFPPGLRLPTPEETSRLDEDGKWEGRLMLGEKTGEVYQIQVCYLKGVSRSPAVQARRCCFGVKMDRVKAAKRLASQPMSDETLQGLVRLGLL